MSPSLLASIVLTVALFAYIFWPERNPFVQADKTRVDYLRERKEAIYENLRDLNFEYLAGKYPEADYNEQRRALENEAAQTIAEMEALTARGMKSTRTRT
jgi:HEPN domain-containing protein